MRNWPVQGLGTMSRSMSIAQTTRCDKCGGVVFLDASPGSKQDLLCPSCAAEESALLVANTAMGEREDDQIVPEVKRQWVVWALSFGAWSAIGIIAGISMYQVDRSFGKPASLLDELRLPLINALSTRCSVLLFSRWLFAIRCNGAIGSASLRFI